MFPVPAHLPRGGAEHLSSDAQVNAPGPADPVLDLLNPLLAQAGPSKPARWSVAQVRKVREDLESAVNANKTKTHHLVTSNFPAISTHIRLGKEIQEQSASVIAAVQRLEKSLDPSDPEASFLPPFLEALSRHASAVQGHARAQTHLQGLRRLSTLTDDLEKLENAIWTGHGAEAWVLDGLLEHEEGYDMTGGDEVLRGSHALRHIKERRKALRGLVTQQATDALEQAISIVKSASNRTTLRIQMLSRLQLPKAGRPAHIGFSNIEPAQYRPASLLKALDRLGHLEGHIKSLQHRLETDVIRPLLGSSSPCRPVINRSDTAITIDITPAEATPIPVDIFQALDSILQVVETDVFPPDSFSKRDQHLQASKRFVLRSILDDLLLPDMPSDLDAVQIWLDSVKEASVFETKILEGTVIPPVIAPFYEDEARAAWAVHRRRSTEERVRSIILNGWEGWQAVDTSRQKEVSIMVEVEVDEDEALAVETTLGTAASGTNGSAGMHDDWGFEEDKKPAESGHDAADVMDTGEEEEGWGFDESAKTGAAPVSVSDKDGDQSMQEEDGWAFDEPIVPVVQPTPKPTKPAREAKRLGKKVARAKVRDEDEPMTSEAESSVTGSALGKDLPVRSNGHTEPVDDWGAWEDPPSAQLSAPRRKRKELREEKTSIEETFLVSKACETLLSLAEGILQESQKLSTMSFSSPSFSNSATSLSQSASDVFDVYRSLLPIVYAQQLRDVPALAMQVYNDALHLAGAVGPLVTSHSWQDGADVARRLKLWGDAILEEQLRIQRESLMLLLDDLGGLADTASDAKYRQHERTVGQIRHNLESLAKVVKAVLPATTYLLVMGYLIDCVVERISEEILALADIPDVESGRLNELLKALHALEQVFVLSPSEPSTIVAQVPHWLKFCYLSELLQASLVDVAYLNETGALVDFTSDELVTLIKALFADSEKRDKAIESVERGAHAGSIIA